VSIPLDSLDPIRHAVERRPLGLVCDVDGTLSPMAATPVEARVTERNQLLLEALSERILVAAVSGRDLPSLRRMLAIPRMIYIGLHGLAWLVDGREQLIPEAEPYREPTLETAAELRAVTQIPGVIVEVKTVGLGFHLRGAPDPASARATVLEAIADAPAAAAFQVHEGILMIELRPPVVSNKGLAIRRLAEQFQLQGLLFLGDDITDIDGFNELRRLRESGSVDAYGIAVTHPEAPPAAAEAADFTVPDISGVERLLGEIAVAVSATTV
jgi:trehalose 6-phosphate phosphatase